MSCRCHTGSVLTTIPHGIRLGIRGHWRTSTWSAISKVRLRGEVNYLAKNWRFTSSSQWMVRASRRHAKVKFMSILLGFFKSISLRNVNALQYTLRLLTLWFKYGAHDDVSHAMATGFSNVEVDTWLEVIPQIIARIQTPSSNIRRNITHLLTDVGKHHPQALIYPLTVAAKSSSTPRRSVAQGIMDRMRDHSPIIVDQVYSSRFLSERSINGVHR